MPATLMEPTKVRQTRPSKPPQEFVAPPTSLQRQQRILDGFASSNLTWKQTDWITFFWMTGIHAGCLLAPFYFSWSGLAVAAMLGWLTGSIGICLGYHRYLSHRSFKLTKPAEFFVLLCGVLSGQGSPITWSATHRVHHQRSDRAGDPHSPVDGGWWSHLLWLFVNRTPQQHEDLFKRYAPDLVNKPVIGIVLRTPNLWALVDRNRRCLVLARGHAVAHLGIVCAHDDCLSRHMVRQFGHAFVGLSKLRND